MGKMNMNLVFKIRPRERREDPLGTGLEDGHDPTATYCSHLCTDWLAFNSIETLVLDDSLLYSSSKMSSILSHIVCMLCLIIRNP